MVDTLLNKRALVDTEDIRGTTALMLAAGRGHIKVAKRLIEYTLLADLENPKPQEIDNNDALKQHWECCKRELNTLLFPDINNRNNRYTLHSLLTNTSEIMLNKVARLEREALEERKVRLPPCPIYQRLLEKRMEQKNEVITVFDRVSRILFYDTTVGTVCLGADEIEKINNFLDPKARRNLILASVIDNSSVKDEATGTEEQAGPSTALTQGLAAFHPESASSTYGERKTGIEPNLQKVNIHLNCPYNR